jgi:hypothetical protein
MMLPIHNTKSMSLALALALGAAGLSVPALAATAKPAAKATAKPAAKPAAKSAKAAPSSAGGPSLLGHFTDWYAYSNGSGSTQVCYILSQPKDMQPKGAPRDATFFLISSWPGKNVMHEPSLVPGYPYKDDDKPRVTVGADKFDFFSRNDKDSGGAWLKDTSEEMRLVASMKNGSQMTITGTNSKGVLTTDTYSLSGISAALQKIDSVCK